MEAIDDPYKILALNIVASYSDKDLSGIMHNAKVIRRHILRETKGADFYGDFLDCIMTILVQQNKDREVGHTLYDTADFFYEHLDVSRLRKEIVHYCNEWGREIKPY